MVKVKPTWICQSCEKAFTTKYSLCRHFKRFPSHAPANLEGSDLKPVTVTIDENVRTVQAIPVSGSSARKHNNSSALATPYGTRNKGGKGKGKRGNSSSSSASAAKAMRMATTTGGSRRVVPVPVSAESHAHGHPMLVDTPSSSSHSYFGTPAAANGGSSSNAAFHPTNGGFPFLPPFLEDEQILNIATPQQHQQSSSAAAAASPLPSSSSNREPLSPMGAHYSWMFTKDKTAAGPGGDLLSPLAPACNYGQVFSEEAEETLQQLARKQQNAHQHLRSPVELADLDQSLLLGDEEATSPFAFLEKTSSAGTDPILPKGTSLDFLASPGFSNSSYHHPTRRSAAVSLEDLDFGFAF